MIYFGNAISAMQTKIDQAEMWRIFHLLLVAYSLNNLVLLASCQKMMAKISRICSWFCEAAEFFLGEKIHLFVDRHLHNGIFL